MLQSIENSIEFKNSERIEVKKRSRAVITQNTTYLAPENSVTLDGGRDLSLGSVLLSLKEYSANLLCID
ncbi:hypothetical protein E4412_11345 [Leptospira interrogans]|nr:hypothetical protein E4412_11345 [Leptospira interrogans]